MILIKFKARQKESMALGRKAVVIAGCGGKVDGKGLLGNDGLVLLLGHGWFSW